MTTQSSGRGRKTSQSALSAQFDVFMALILRDIKTRFFGHGLGYFIAIGWPLVHILILLIVYVAAGRTSPTGSSVLVFLAVSVVPVINYMYMSRLIPFSVAMNKPLMGLPPVKLMDIIFARAVLEAAAAVVTAFCVFAIIYTMDVEIEPTDVPQLACAYIANLLLALGVGSLAGVIATRVTGVLVAMTLMNIILYMASGIVFMVNAMPTPVQYGLSFNPVLHSVEWAREAYYVNYVSPVLDKQYLIGFGVVTFVLALSIDRIFRRFLTAV